MPICRSSQVHDDGQDHGLAFGSSIQELGKIVPYAVFELDAVDEAIPFQLILDGTDGDLTGVFHQLLGLAHVDEATGYDIGTG